MLRLPQEFPKVRLLLLGAREGWTVANQIAAAKVPGHYQGQHGQHQRRPAQPPVDPPRPRRCQHRTAAAAEHKPECAEKFRTEFFHLC